MGRGSWSSNQPAAVGLRSMAPHRRKTASTGGTDRRGWAHVALPQSGIEDGTPPPGRPDLVELLERGQLASALTGSDRLRSTHSVDIGDGMYSLERR